MHRVDTALGVLIAGLKQRHLYDGTNIVIVSDHGMAASANARSIVLDDVVDLTKAKVRSVGTVAGIDPQPGQDGPVAAALLALHPHFACWRKADDSGAVALWQQSPHPRLCLSGRRGWLAV